MRKIIIKSALFISLFLSSVMVSVIPLKAAAVSEDTGEPEGYENIEDTDDLGILSAEDRALLEEAAKTDDEAPDFARMAKGFRSINDPELKVSYEGGFFTYEMPNGGTFSMNIPLGGITDKAVQLRAGEDTWITSFVRNGKESLKKDTAPGSVSEAFAAASDEDEKIVDIQKTGRYDFRVMSTSIDRSGMTLCSSCGAFCIAGSGKPLWTSYLTAPFGYEISSVKLNGREIKAKGERLELKKDGLYEAEFKPADSSLPVYRSVFKRDTTAPVLHFTPELTGKTMTEKVSYRSDEKDAVIRAYLNNREILPADMTASADGDWRIVISDETGNENVYTFRLKLKEKGPVKGLLLLIPAGIIAGAFVTITAHSRMRII